jgi:hypothetical protein
MARVEVAAFKVCVALALARVTLEAGPVEVEAFAFAGSVNLVRVEVGLRERHSAGRRPSAVLDLSVWSSVVVVVDRWRLARPRSSRVRRCGT